MARVLLRLISSLMGHACRPHKNMHGTQTHRFKNAYMFHMMRTQGRLVATLHTNGMNWCMHDCMHSNMHDCMHSNSHSWQLVQRHF